MRRRAVLKAGRGVPPRASPGKPARSILDDLAGKACPGVSPPPHFFMWFLPGSNSLPAEAVGPGLGQSLPAAASSSLGVLFARSCLRDARPAPVPCTPGLFSLITENKMKNSGPWSHWSYFKCSVATRVLDSAGLEHSIAIESSHGQSPRGSLREEPVSLLQIITADLSLPLSRYV